MFEEYLLEERRDLLAQAKALKQQRDSLIQRVRWIEKRAGIDNGSASDYTEPE